MSDRERERSWSKEQQLSS